MPQSDIVANTKKWTLNRQDEYAIENGCWFDYDAAIQIADFFPTFLCHYEGIHAGNPFELLPWQYDFVMRLFGWKRINGTRRFRHGSIWIPKKNGKTAFATGFVFIGLLADRENAPKVYSAATARDQAALIFNNAAQMVENSPELQRVLTVKDSEKKIVCPRVKGFYESLSADAGVNEGKNASMLIKDELHAWSTGPGRRLYGSLRYAGRARHQSLNIEISTAGQDLESIGYERYRYMKQIQEETILNWKILPLIFEAEPDKGDSPGDEKVWAKANPSLHKTIDIEEMRSDWEEAEQSPTSKNDFLRYQLNIWVAAKARWILPEQWSSTKVEGITPESLIGRPCCGGLDLALVDDSSAWILCFPLGGERFALLAHFFLPEDGILEKAADDGVDYHGWRDQGHYTLTNGPTTDYEFIKQRIIDDHEKYDIRETAYDPYKATVMASELSADEGLEMIPFRQGFLSMSEPCKSFHRAVINKQIMHFDNPVLRWMFGSAIATSDPSGNIKLDKAASKKKIDGAVGSVMAFARARSIPDLDHPYGGRGVLTLENL